MTIQISDLPEFGPAMASYRVDKAAAEQAGDQLAIAKADQAWAEKRLELTTMATQRATEAQAVDAALAKAKADYPRAPEVVYSALKDPASIVAAAKEAHDAVVAAAGQPSSPAQPPQGQQGWGGQPPAGAPAPVGEDDIAKREAELVPQVLRGKAGERENEEFRRLIFRDHLGSKYQPGPAR